MTILVLGGTLFLSQAVATAALAAGHDVVCAARGRSGEVPEGARFVAWDREQTVPAELAHTAYDVVVDVARTPSWVRRSVAAWPVAHHVFVSTINVYADESTPGGRPGALPLRDPQPEDVDPASGPEAYGAMKVACEQIVLAGAASASVVRPGLIVGPGDPTGRFAYWPVRVADGGEVLAPGDPGDAIQVIDVRDLAAWLVLLAERRTAGVFDAVGPVVALGDLLAQVAIGVGASVTWTWVGQERLIEAGVAPWSGSDSLPLWLPRPTYDGLLAHDPTPARDAGLRARPIAESARDTLAWVRSTPSAVVTGIDRARETGLLAARLE